MGVESYLVDGEEILAQAGNFYATNKRLLRYKKHLKGEEIEPYEYTLTTKKGEKIDAIVTTKIIEYKDKIDSLIQNAKDFNTLLAQIGKDKQKYII